MKKWLPILAAPLLFCACEGNTTRVFTIHNHSADEIEVQVESFQDSVYTLGVQSEQQVLWTDMLGGQSFHGQVADYIQVLRVIQGQDTSEVDFRSNTPWDIESKQHRRAPSHWEHRFELVVEQEDF